MNDLKEILNLIEKTYYTSMPNDEKHEKLAGLWSYYYKISKKENIKLDEAYNLYLLGESESYIINQEPIRTKVDKEQIQNAIRNIDYGLTLEMVHTLLDWSVENTRKSFEILGLNVSNCSLNGFCELGQALSLLPFEKIGLKVTKNTAKDSFDYPFNHAFGTVTFPVIDGENITEETYLIDTTYRQFFSTVRCNEGRYYTEEENTLKDTAPDPGYFIEDVDFAKELMATGYIKLTEENAQKYGETFFKASLPLAEKDKVSNINYYDRIKNQSGEYLTDTTELDGLNTEFPGKTGGLSI